MWNGAQANGLSIHPIYPLRHQMQCSAVLSLLQTNLYIDIQEDQLLNSLGFREMVDYKLVVHYSEVYHCQHTGVVACKVHSSEIPE